jgi:FMN phosphatase YigB (HAD superfamily)
MNAQLEAVLFDLDGTLLDNDISVFLTHYFPALADHVAAWVPRARFIPALVGASEVMRANDGRDTNQELFARAFFPAVGRTREELEPVFMDFYAREFPKLRRYTRRKPEARAAVQAAFDRGCDVVIATNPLFPRTAIEQRLEWAGVAGLPYRLVTSYENSRAAKPERLYYQQILETIGRPAEVCLMVGDEDIDMAAGHLGCLTFLVPGSRTELHPDTPVPTYRGTLTDLITLLADTE